MPRKDVTEVQYLAKIGKRTIDIQDFQYKQSFSKVVELNEHFFLFLCCVWTLTIITFKHWIKEKNEEKERTTTLWKASVSQHGIEFEWERTWTKSVSMLWSFRKPLYHICWRASKLQRQHHEHIQSLGISAKPFGTNYWLLVKFIFHPRLFSLPSADCK